MALPVPKTSLLLLRRTLLAAAAGAGAAGALCTGREARAADRPPGSAVNPLTAAMRRAHAMRDEAVRAGDQAFGAVVVLDARIVGESPSRVVQNNDPTAHAEMEAIRDAARRLGRRDLAGAVLVSTSRPCRMCEAAAGWAGIVRMVHGDALNDAGAPR